MKSLDYLKIVVVLAVWLALTTGCTDDSCATQEDCFSGETCVDGTCRTAQPSQNNSNNSNNTNTNNSNNASNNANNTNNASNNANNSNTNNSNTNNANNTLACVVDPFDGCSDDENDNNNAWPGEYATTMTRGCPTNEFKGLDMTINGKICPLEPADIYNFIFYDCEVGFVIEALLTPKRPCDSDLINFDMSGLGRCGGDNPNLRCQVLEDGTHHVQLLVPGTDFATGKSVYFYVDTFDRMDIEFEYDLQLIVRQ